MELLLELLIEFFGQLLIELLVEFGLRIPLRKATGSDKAWNSLLSGGLYVFVAALCAAASLQLFPNHFIKSLTLRQLNLVVAPALVGLIMGYRGKLLESKGQQALRLDSFWFGYLFALVFALIRFLAAK